MARKSNTFIVQKFKDWVNQNLKRTDDDATEDFKNGLCAALEHVLLQSGQYKGYIDNYWQERGYIEWQQAGQPEGPEKEKFVYGPSGQKFNRHYY